MKKLITNKQHIDALWEYILDMDKKLDGAIEENYQLNLRVLELENPDKASELRK